MGLGINPNIPLILIILPSLIQFKFKLYSTSPYVLNTVSKQVSSTIAASYPYDTLIPRNARLLTLEQRQKEHKYRY